jgi:hypothetical protein
MRANQVVAFLLVGGFLSTGADDIRIQRLTRDGERAPGWPAGGIRRQGVWGADTPPKGDR